MMPTKMTRKKRIVAFCLTLLLFPLQATLAEDIGKPAPDCQFAASKKQPVLNLNQIKGKVVYVDFWASWCGPCAKSFPFMNRLNADFKGKGLEVIAVNLDENPEDAQAFLDKYPHDFQVVSDNDSQCAKDFEVSVMPSSYLIDKKGTVRYVNLGFREEETQALPALIEKLLAEAP